METNTSYGRYLDGKELYSNGRQSPATLSNDGWVVAPWIPVTDQQRMAGAAIMRWAVVEMIEAGDPLNEEVVFDLAHALRSLNHGQITGVFIPSVAADTHVVVSEGLEDAEQAREEIASSLQESSTVQADRVQSLLDTLVAADYGHIKGLAAPFINASVTPNANQHGAPKKQKKITENQPKAHIQYLALLHQKSPAATARELRKHCIEAARSHQGSDDERFPFHLVRGEIALKGTQRVVSEGAFANWFTASKKLS